MAARDSSLIQALIRCFYDSPNLIWKIFMPWSRRLRHLSINTPPITNARARLIQAFACSVLFCATMAFNPSPAYATGTSDIPPITRTVLERRPIPGTDQDMELILVTFQPGVSAPLHHHPVAGLNYIVEGTAESAYGQDAPKLYRAGDTLQDLPNVPHTIFRNADKHNVLRFLIFANLRADQPYTIIP